MPRQKKEVVLKLLENLPWTGVIAELETHPEKSYTRLHDDHDGTGEGILRVTLLKNGDAVVQTDDCLRFRSIIGGTHSPRIRNALVILALAIKLDTEDEEKREKRKEEKIESL
jgi:hypothetical protein